MSNEKIKIVMALTAGLCIGGGIGYILGERKVRSEAKEEIDSVKNLYRRLREEDAEQARKDWDAAPVDAEEDLDDDSQQVFEEIAVSQGYTSAEAMLEARLESPNNFPTTDQEPGGDDVEQDLREEDEYVRNIRVVNPHRNVDPDDVTQWDRDAHHPYVITEEEFRIDHPEHEKLSITYYRGDDTLVDEQDQFIPDLEGTVGNQNLQYFGLASRDERLLHIRNERVGADFEVSLDDGSYSRDVLGFGIEDDMVVESKNEIRKMRHRE